MSDETNVARIVAYIEAHRAAHSADALREQLLAVGYTAEDIDVAFGRLAPLPATGATIALTPETTPQQVSPSAPDATLAQLVGYLREHSGQYSLDALRGQLLAEGRNPTLVDEAVAMVRAEQPKTTGAIWPMVALLTLGNTVILPMVGGMLGSMLGQFDDSGIVFLLGLLFTPLVILGELIWGIVLMGGERARLGRILVFGAVYSIIVPLVLLALLFGICVILLSGASFR